MDPTDILTASIVNAQEELDIVDPYLCVECGEPFTCLDDVIFHILADHRYIMCKLNNGKLISYPEFIEKLSGKIVESIIIDAQAEEYHGNDCECTKEE